MLVGKTAILYKMKYKRNVQTIPTIGFNIETITPVEGINFTVWDISFQEKMIPLWVHYFTNTEGMPIFDIFAYYVYMFYSHIVVNIVEFHATVIQVRGIASHKSTIFYIRKWLYQVRNMTVLIHSFDVFEVLIFPFNYGLSVLNFPRSSVFFWFFFLGICILAQLSFCRILTQNCTLSVIMKQYIFL